MVGASSNIVLNLVLIPYFGLKGAAIATVISELVFSLYMFYYFINPDLFKGLNES